MYIVIIRLGRVSEDFVPEITVCLPFAVNISNTTHIIMHINISSAVPCAVHRNSDSTMMFFHFHFSFAGPPCGKPCDLNMCSLSPYSFADVRRYYRYTYYYRYYHIVIMFCCSRWVLREFDTETCGPCRVREIERENI